MRHIAGIDHVVIAVRDLDRAQDAFTRLGFTLTPRGHHNLGSQNHSVMLGADYVELLAVPQPHPALQYFSDFVAVGDGLSAIAFATDDASAAHAELEQVGISAAPPLDLSRPIELVEGTRTASFRVVLLSAQATSGSLAFLCQQLTREHVWRPEHQAHAIGATAIAEIAFIAEDAAACAEGYARILGARPERIGDRLRLRTRDVSLTFGSRSTLEHRLAGVALPPREPAAAALFLRCADRAAAAECLRRGGHALVEIGDGSVAIGAEHAHGVALVFV